MCSSDLLKIHCENFSIQLNTLLKHSFFFFKGCNGLLYIFTQPFLMVELKQNSDFIVHMHMDNIASIFIPVDFLLETHLF